MRRFTQTCLTTTRPAQRGQVNFWQTGKRVTPASHAGKVYRRRFVSDALGGHLARDVRLASPSAPAPPWSSKAIWQSGSTISSESGRDVRKPIRFDDQAGQAQRAKQGATIASKVAASASTQSVGGKLSQHDSPGDRFPACQN